MTITLKDAIEKLEKDIIYYETQIETWKHNLNVSNQINAMYSLEDCNEMLTISRSKREITAEHLEMLKNLEVKPITTDAIDLLDRVYQKHMHSLIPCDNQNSVEYAACILIFIRDLRKLKTADGIAELMKQSNDDLNREDFNEIVVQYKN